MLSALLHQTHNCPFCLVLEVFNQRVQYVLGPFGLMAQLTFHYNMKA